MSKTYNDIEAVTRLLEEVSDWTIVFSAGLKVFSSLTEPDV